MMESKKIKVIVSLRSVPAVHVIENSNKIAKKLKKLKNMVVASF